MAKQKKQEIIELLMEHLKQEEIAFFSYSEIYTWGCSDIQTFEFSAASGLRFRGWV
jgi:predicted lipase